MSPRRAWRRLRGRADRLLSPNIRARLRSLGRVVGERPVLGLPVGARITVVAPHPDDDVLMSGGTIAMLVARGARVTVVAVTDGEAGGDPALARDAVAESRRDEQERACSLLGVDGVVRLGFPDGGVADRLREFEAALRRHLDGLRPTAIMVPWWGDGHPDHAACTRAVAAVADDGTEIWCGEVWTPLIPNRLVDVTEVFDSKRAALACHETAAAAFDLDSLLALSRYRSALALGGRGYAEAFLALSPEGLRLALPPPAHP